MALVTALAAVAVAVLAALAAVGVSLVAADLTVVRVTALARAGGELGLLVPGLGGGRRRRLGLPGRVVDGDRDADRAAALAAQRVTDDRCETSFEDALREFVRNREQRGVRDQCQRLAALDPVLVLRLHTLTAALTEELFQYSWPHCGKIGRYVSHRARSLTGPTNVWFWEQVGKSVGWGGGNKSAGAVGRERIGVQPR
ncbi:hypothetical protein HEP87_60525 [Streptomyces sp. S1D4-11]